MASVSDIALVRRNTNEPTAESFDDPFIGTLIDAAGVDGASAEVWRLKAGRYAELVNVSEAGASESLGDLHKQALSMEQEYLGRVAIAVTATHPRVSEIERR
jgi:hypothetical protein